MHPISGSTLYIRERIFLVECRFFFPGGVMPPLHIRHSWWVVARPLPPHALQVLLYPACFLSMVFPRAFIIIELSGLYSQLRPRVQCLHILPVKVTTPSSRHLVQVGCVLLRSFNEAGKIMILLMLAG